MTHDQARLYEQLVESSSGAGRELGRQLRLSQEELHTGLAGLRELGLVVADPLDPSEVTVLPPDLALEVLIRRKEDELHRVRARAAQLGERHRRAADPRHERKLIEIVRGADQIDTRVRLLERQARYRLDVLSTPPYAGRFVPMAEELGVLERGVHSRVIYSRQALEQDGAVETLEQLRAAGEEARIAAQVPMKLLLVDGETALIPLSPDPQGQAAIVVHPGGLLDALSTLFEMLWARSRPYLGAELALRPLGLDKQERQLLALLAGGLKDETVARHLGLSLRTVRRRIAALMEWAGATTRFEAGYLLGSLAPDSRSASGGERPPPTPGEPNSPATTGLPGQRREP
jgi:DNA-binding NarL/FixJ family response regulator